MKLNIKRAYRVWQRHFKVYTKLYKSSIVFNFIEPIMYLVALGFGLGAFVKEVDGVPYINFIAPGLIASSAMFATASECTYGTFVRMTYQKTFDAILATPVNIDDLTAGELLWGATKSIFYGTAITIVLSMFGMISSPMIIFIIPVLFLSGLIFAETAVMAAALAPGIDSFSYFFTLLLTPSFLFSGIFFPLDTLHPLVTKIAFFTPLYHLVNVCRAFASGSFHIVVWDIVWIIAVCAFLAPYPFRLMRKRIIK